MRFFSAVLTFSDVYSCLNVSPVDAIIDEINMISFLWEENSDVSLAFHVLWKFSVQNCIFKLFFILLTFFFNLTGHKGYSRVEHTPLCQKNMHLLYLHAGHVLFGCFCLKICVITCVKNPILMNSCLLISCSDHLVMGTCTGKETIKTIFQIPGQKWGSSFLGTQNF